MVKDDVLFSASGVTDGDIVKGIKSDNDYFYVETFFLHKSTNTNSIIKNKIKKLISLLLVEKTGYSKSL